MMYTENHYAFKPLYSTRLILKLYSVPENHQVGLLKQIVGLHSWSF